MFFIINIQTRSKQLIIRLLKVSGTRKNVNMLYKKIKFNTMNKQTISEKKAGIVPEKWVWVFSLAIVLFTFNSCSQSKPLATAHPSQYEYTTIAGSEAGHLDGPGNKALLYSPEGITVDSKGNLFVTEYRTSIVRKISPDGTVSVLAGKAMELGDTDAKGAAARFSRPHGLVAVGDSVMYVCDMKNFTIRKVLYDGTVTTFAGISGEEGSLDGYRTKSTFSQTEAIAVNSKGDLFVADSYNFTIRKISANGMVSTLAGVAKKPGYADGTGADALFNKPLGIAIDGNDNIYIADCDYDGEGGGNCLIRKITPGGKVTTFAGIPKSPGHKDGNRKKAQFDRPVGITVTSDGIIYLADTEADLIRKIDKKGNVTTIGGTYLEEKFADGMGSEARFADPQSIVVDKNGILYIADTFNNRIRKGTKK